MKEGLLNLAAREAPVYVAASVIAYIMSEYFRLPLGEESTTTGFAVAGGFAGAWFGRRAWRGVLVPVLAFIFFCVAAGAYLLMRYFLPDPPFPVILLEIIAFGWASFCFFWAASGAGAHLLEPTKVQGG